MLEFEEQRLLLLESEPALKELRAALDVDALATELKELEEKSADPNFWEDLSASQSVLQRIRQVKDKILSYTELESLFGDTLALIEIAEETGDASVLDEVTESVAQVKDRTASLKLSTLLTGEYDVKSAILTFHAGAGGTEAQDWVQMLYRMYTRWAERHRHKYKVLDYLPGEEAQGLSVRFMGIDDTGTGTYLLTMYCSVAVLTDDAAAVLEDVETGHFYDYD